MKKGQANVPLLPERTAANFNHPWIGPQKFWRKKPERIGLCSFNSFWSVTRRPLISFPLG